MAENKKDILIISHFVDFPWEKGNDRFIYIATLLQEKGKEVELVTSDFIHNQKKYRNKRELLKAPLDFKVTLLHEEKYNKNVCIKRVFSHKGLGKNLKNYLAERRIPDIIYCAVPSLDVARAASDFAEKYHVKFVIDIQDLWPEAFEMVNPFKSINQIVFHEMKKRANEIYKRADAIVAVSDTYLSRGKQVNQKATKGLSVFLGTEFKSFDQYKEMQCIPKGNTEIWIAYVGTLGHSYDLTRVIDAIRMLNNPNIRFIVLGDGPLKMKFQQYADKKHVHAIFMGRISYPEMVSVLCQCDIAVNPIMKGAAQSIINKVGDYAAAGLPVISTQECKEYRNLIETYQCGFNCDNENTVELAEKIKILIEHPNMRKKMGNNNRKLGEEKFDRRITYPMICQLLIEEL